MRRLRCAARGRPPCEGAAARPMHGASMSATQPEELNRILQSAADRRASDVHLLPGEPACYRVGVAGEIERADGPPLSADEIARLATEVIGKHRLAADLAEAGRSFASVSLPGTVHGKLVAATAGGVLT